MLRAIGLLAAMGLAFLLLSGQDNKPTAASAPKVQMAEVTRLEGLMQQIMEQQTVSEAARLERLGQIAAEVAELSSKLEKDTVRPADVAKYVATAMKGPEVAPPEPEAEAEKPAEGSPPAPAPAAEATPAPVKAEVDGSCNCAERFNEIQKQLDTLKQQIPVASSAPAAAASSYGSVADARPVKSGGSTGSVTRVDWSTGSVKATSSGGSTGSVKATSSGGSTGSVRAASSGGSTGSVVRTGSVNPPPTPLRNVAATLLDPVVNRNHWTFPGAIDGHLNSDHAAQLLALGISTDGMSREQMLSLHDGLHEGSIVAPTASYVSSGYTGAPVIVNSPMPAAAAPPRRAAEPVILASGNPFADCPDAYQTAGGQWVCPKQAASTKASGWSPILPKAQGRRRIFGGN